MKNPERSLRIFGSHKRKLEKIVLLGYNDER